jgi:predicted Fe-Mo cluster-binding NifX family protein
MSALTLLMASVVAVHAADAPPSEDRMLFAVAADSAEPTSPVAQLAGIAPFFHIYVENGDPVKVVANPFLDMEYGTGPAVANMLLDEGVDVIVGRRIPGPKFMEVMEARGARFVRRVETVDKVAQELRE